MNSILIRWERRAATELKALQKKDQQKVFDSVTDLRNDPLKGKPLSGRWKGLRRLRVGRYRVIYGFDGEELLVLIVRVGHRRDVYR